MGYLHSLTTAPAWLLLIAILGIGLAGCGDSSTPLMSTAELQAVVDGCLTETNELAVKTKYFNRPYRLKGDVVKVTELDLEDGKGTRIVVSLDAGTDGPFIGMRLPALWVCLFPPSERKRATMLEAGDELEVVGKLDSWVKPEGAIEIMMILDSPKFINFPSEKALKAARDNRPKRPKTNSIRFPSLSPPGLPTTKASDVSAADELAREAADAAKDTVKAAEDALKNLVGDDTSGPSR